MTKSADLATPDYVVLGMIRLGARTGYDIKTRVARSIRFFWTISEAQIYPSLERLERAAFIEGRAEPNGRRRRRVFALTPSGESALRDWLVRVEPMPFELRDVGLVRLFFADMLDRGEALALLASVKARSEERVAMLRSIEPDSAARAARDTVHPLLTLRMGVAFHVAIVEVCEQFEREIDGA